MAGSLAAVQLRSHGAIASEWRDAAIPLWMGADDGLVLLSYSGETWEAMAMLEHALEQKVPCRVVASGGGIAARAEGLGIPVFRVPAGLAPRASLPWLLAGALRATGGADAEEINAVIALLRAERSSREPRRDPVRIAQLLRERMTCLLPVGTAMEVVGLRWRNQILENAKQAAIVSPLPEMAHNEIMGWPHYSELGVPIVFLVLVDRRPTEERLESVFRALKSEASRLSHPFEMVTPPPAEGLGAQLAQVYLGDRVSVELADQRGVAATPVDAIGRLRGEIRKENDP
jgi:glucose/mannose-6-phosphate isomerase